MESIITGNIYWYRELFSVMIDFLNTIDRDVKYNFIETMECLTGNVCYKMPEESNFESFTIVGSWLFLAVRFYFSNLEWVLLFVT